MKILVCIKQVPGTTQVDIDEKTGVLKRSPVAAKMNPYDLYGIETALQIKTLNNAEISALTMGPPYSEAVIRESYMLGVDNGFLLSGREFGGADCLATSYALSQAVRFIGMPDLIICGKQTTDGDTAQVGSELSEFLNIPSVSNVLAIHEVKDHSIVITHDLGFVTQTVEIMLPCLITVEKDIFEPRLPSYKKKMATKDRPIQVISFADMPDNDKTHYGLNGSPTRVVRVFPPTHDSDNRVWTGTAAETARQMSDMLLEKKLA